MKNLIFMFFSTTRVLSTIKEYYVLIFILQTFAFT